MTEQRLIYFWPPPNGGVADYAKYQVNALLDLGVDVQILCSPDFKYLPDFRNICHANLSQPSPFRIRKLRQASYARCILGNISKLHGLVKETGIDAVLFANFPCLMSPLWARKMERLKRKGVKLGTMLHDPALDYVVGPRVWNDYSNQLAFKLQDFVFTHYNPNLEQTYGKANILVVPHGPYDAQHLPLTKSECRDRLNIKQSSFLLLFFGHLRDNKNLNLVIHAIAELKSQGISDLHLMVAGNEPAGQVWTAQKYKALARELQVDNITWRVGFVPDEQIPLLFSASDAILLTYSASFTSASGVLNLASHFELPCIVSGGDGPLRYSVERFDLGPVVSPDSAECIARGIVESREYRASSLAGSWARYREESTWSRNAGTIIATFWPEAGRPKGD